MYTNLLWLVIVISSFMLGRLYEKGKNYRKLLIEDLDKN